MPLSLNPDRTVDVWLPSDAEIPLEKRPVFVCRFLTARQVERIYEHRKAALSLQTLGPATIAELLKALGIAVVGWRNFLGEYSPDKLADVLTIDEMYDLCFACISRSDAAEIDLKNSASPSALTTAPSVEAAPAPAPVDAAK